MSLSGAFDPSVGDYADTSPAELGRGLSSPTGELSGGLPLMAPTYHLVGA